MTDQPKSDRFYGVDQRGRDHVELDRSRTRKKAKPPKKRKTEQPNRDGA